MKKWVCIALFWLLSLYPPAELTRYIIAFQNRYGYELQFKLEIYLIWISYALMMSLFGLILWTKWEDK